MSPIFVEITCLALPVIEGGSIQYSSGSNEGPYDIGIVASYYCGEGYSLENGDQSRTCQASGMWGGKAPGCIGTCTPLGVPDNGGVSYSMEPDENIEYLNGTVASFVCDDGYELFGYQESICQHNMIWSTGSPSCESE